MPGDYIHPTPLRAGEPQIEWGRTNGLVDGVGNIVAIPSKVLLLDSRVDDHSLTACTVGLLSQYLADNGLGHVKVRINQYAPGREWRRLARNRGVGAGWRYTLGAVAVALYTILPGRVFGGDNYNPYTDTISLYSDHPAVALHEAAHAKDFALRRFKGTYAAGRLLPGVALYHEAVASGDAIGYLREQGALDEEIAAYKILYPAYCTYIGGEFARFTGAGDLLIVAAVIPGHIVGRVKASRERTRREPPATPAE